MRSAVRGPPVKEIRSTPRVRDQRLRHARPGGQHGEPPGGDTGVEQQLDKRQPGQRRAS